MFEIRFNSGQLSAELALGTILVGSFKETFEAPLHFWTRRDYESQWRRASERLLNGAASSAFITGMNDPQHANFIHWWPAYLVGAEVRFQHQLLMLPNLDFEFTVENHFEHVPPYRQENDEGDRLSQWVVPLISLSLPPLS